MLGAFGDPIASCLREPASFQGCSLSENMSHMPGLSVDWTSPGSGAEKKLGSVPSSLKTDQTAAAKISLTQILFVIPS